MNSKTVKRGEIYYANLNPVVGSEQGGSRPVLIVSNNVGNKHGPTVVVTPITCVLKKKLLPTHVLIPQSVGLEVDSLALAEQIKTLDRSRLGEFVGRINSTIQAEIDNALAVCVGIDENRYKEAEILTLCLCSHCERDFSNSGCILIKKGWQRVKTLCDFCGTRNGLTFGIFNKDMIPARVF